MLEVGRGRSVSRGCLIRAVAGETDAAVGLAAQVSFEFNLTCRINSPRSQIVVRQDEAREAPGSKAKLNGAGAPYRLNVVDGSNAQPPLT